MLISRHLGNYKASVLPVILTAVLFGYLSTIYFAIFVVDVFEKCIWLSVLLGTIFGFITILLAISHLRCYLTDPGIAPENMVHSSIFVNTQAITPPRGRKVLSHSAFDDQNPESYECVEVNDQSTYDTGFNSQSTRTPDSCEAVKTHAAESNHISKFVIDPNPTERTETLLTSSTFVEFENIQINNEEENTKNQSLKKPLIKITPESYAREYQFCFKCNRVKPPRCHHCSTCKRCVLRMDHHCPWVGNCVGFENHKYFILFLFYSALACLQEAISLSVAIILGMGRIDDKIQTHYMMGLVLSSSIFIAVAGLLALHIYLMCKNTSTIEIGFYEQNPFDMKDWRTNFGQVFGTRKLTWLFPTCPKGRLSNGMEYPELKENAYA